MPFNFIVHARGTGKTFGTLQYAVDNHIPFIYMRRTQTALDLVNNNKKSPFKPLNEKLGYNIYPFPDGSGSAVFCEGGYNKKGKLIPRGEPYGISLALSTVASVRGVGMGDYDLLFYDEFIREQHEKPMNGEGAAFANAYETLNRNRELDGDPPMLCICAANSNDLGNPIFVYFGLVEEAIKLQKSGRDFILLQDRGVGLFIPHNSPISERKKDTALYRMARNSDFQGMALRNTFMIEGEDTINSANLSEYKPLVTVGVLTVYEHKSNNTYFVSFHKSGNPEVYKNERIELLRFKARYMWLWGAHMEKTVVFETYSAMKIFEEYYKIA